MRCPDTLLVSAFANALFPIGDGRRASVSDVFLAIPGEPRPGDNVTTELSVRTDERFLIDSGSMMLGGFAGSPPVACLSAVALGVVSVFSTLVGSNG